MDETQIDAVAKKIEASAESGTIPDILHRELNKMDPADRLKVAKQITWNQAHENKDPSLPDVDLEFSLDGNLQGVQSVDKHGSVDLDLDPASGRLRAKSETMKDGSGWESKSYTQYNDRGKLTYQVESSTSGHFRTENWSYDAKTGNMQSHQSRGWSMQSSGFPSVRLVDEKFDAQGRTVVTDITSNAKDEHRTYDYGTDGRLHREKHQIKNKVDNTDEELTYTGNGVLMEKLKVFKSGAHNRWTYDPRTGDPLEQEHKDRDGEITRVEFDKATGKWKKK